jgi:iron complex outermembrane receptor protein
MKKLLLAMLGTSCLAPPVFAQAAPDPAPTASAEAEAIVVTGSRIKRNVQDSPLPLQVFTQQDLRRDSVNSPEQFIALLTSNGNGLDNLASNTDVTAGAARGNNGASSANLRNQGAAGTLILLNGRRVPAHGLNGGVVDINQIPLFAMERVEVLKDGASALYGSDAVGGVINFITRDSYEGLNAQGFLDVTEAGGGNIYRGSVYGGVGNLEKDGINLMAGLSISDHRGLSGTQRDFVNLFQPNRGLSPDTRGTPFATIFPLGVTPNTPQGTIINSAGTAPFVPGSTTVRASGGINALDLPGRQGCDAIDGMGRYDDLLWDNATAQFACAWDTAQPAMLQQPIKTVNYYGKATIRIDDHKLYAELTGSKADSAKRFSSPQFSSSLTNSFAFPRTAFNAATYDRVFNQLVAVFPSLEPRRGLPMAVRWRCAECGPREIETTSRTYRLTVGADGPIAGDWDYKVAASYGESDVSSRLGTGYYYRGTNAAGAVIGRGLIPAVNSGFVNIFLQPGETQSPEGMAELERASAAGVTLYGGTFGVWQIDASVAGSLFELPGGTAQMAAGIDWRRESYSFAGDTRPPSEQANPILLAPFDNANALAGTKRTIKAAFAEVLLPVFDGFELTGALRVDDYTGFGRTTNPKIMARYRPIKQVMFRGGYNTSFRVPNFNQIFNGVLESPYAGRDLADPGKCPGGRPNAAIPGCQAIQPNILGGGRLDLGPETAEQFNLGVVFEPTPDIFLTVDWWRIERRGNIVIPDLLTQMVPNYDSFIDQFIRDSSGNLVSIDQRWQNAGGTLTEGIEITGRANFDAWGADWTIGLDATYLLSKRTKVAPGAAYGASEIGVFTFAGDLGLRWRHNLFATYARDDWSVSLSQIFRNGYTNQVLPGVTAGRITPPDLVETTRNYVIYNLSANYNVNERLTVTAGIKNLFDRDPPFAISYDSSTGAGSSWEPRVADPRGRSFTLLVDFRL